MKPLVQNCLSGQFLDTTINDPRIVDAVRSVAKSHFEQAKVIYQKKVIFTTFELLFAKFPKVASFRNLQAKSQEHFFYLDD